MFPSKVKFSPACILLHWVTKLRYSTLQSKQEGGSDVGQRYGYNFYKMLVDLANKKNIVLDIRYELCELFEFTTRKYCISQQQEGITVMTTSGRHKLVLANDTTARQLPANIYPLCHDRPEPRYQEICYYGLWTVFPQLISIL